MAYKDVHVEHCCEIHGCKYGSKDCTVEFGNETATKPCEICAENVNQWDQHGYVDWQPE